MPSLDELRNHQRDSIVRTDLPQKRLVTDLSKVGAQVTDQDVAVVAETAYHRGFTQGAAAALRAMEAGKSKGTIRTWMNDLMTKWRYKRHGGRMECPRELV